MRLANVNGRLTIATPDGHVDVEAASGGRFGPDPQAVYDRWDELRSWADAGPVDGPAVSPAPGGFGPPVPRPTQIFAIGLNYALHAAEAGVVVPDHPPTFTKFQTCLTGPTATVDLPSESVDWEVELVAVIGRRASSVSVADAWSHVAGVMVGQDLSERVVQRVGPIPQFSLGKSFAGFGPTGPELVTPDELADRDNLELGCAIDGETVQKGRTRDMIFPVSELVARLSAVCVLLPGDIIFTGTPDGVGMGRTPPRYLRPGEVLHSWIDGIGTLDTTLRAGATHPSLTTTAP
jgi:2-keto-4-pentenoate hydratase/2-oxohepta-3-ene-1,7-dioic acid hydratase in catechol pathway